VDPELIKAMRRTIIDGAPNAAASLARQALADGLDPLDIINQGYAESMTFVGERYSCRQMFLPDLLASAEAMKAAIAVLEPEIKRRGSQRATLGRVVLGTAKGDIHDIGKNLVVTLLSSSGFEVLDLGTNTAPDDFVSKAADFNADIIGVSALLTTTMVGQRNVIEALDRQGLRPGIKAIIGGAAVTAKWATEIGADGFARNAIDALTLVKSLLPEKVPSA